MQDLRDKVVVITGAGSGIGRALARACAAQGAKLALGDVNLPGLKETVAGIPDDRVLLQKLDVSKRAEVEAFRDAVLQRFGASDLVVNNAGVAVSQTVENLTYEDFEWIVGINFWGVVYGTKAFLPHLKTRPEAALVNISSIFGMIAVPAQGAYNATKFAVRGFTEALRHEMAGTNVHVMCVHPGGIKTNIAHASRFHVGPSGETDHAKAADLFVKEVRTTPEEAARVILDGVARKEVRCLIGADAKVVDWIQRLFPRRYWSLIARMMPKEK
jgi:NAD(P)-dependent dehydrogenase (short-subunit alcohol dehydrogenase family)